MRIGCIGMTTIDTLLFTPQLPTFADEACHVDAVVCLGGKGMVTAQVLSALGTDVVVCTLIGGEQRDYAEVCSYLPSTFETRFLLPWLVRNNRTWIAVSADQTSWTLVNVSPTRSTLRSSRIRRTIESLFQRSNVVYVAMEHMDLLKQVVHQGRHVQHRIVTNISVPLLDAIRAEGSGMLFDLVTVSSAIMMNDVECSQALDQLGIPSWENVQSDRLQEIIITKGEKGGVMSSRPFTDWQTFEAYAPSQIACCIGAGDTFNGAFMVSHFVNGAGLTESCQYAAMIAAKKIALRTSAITSDLHLVGVPEAPKTPSVASVSPLKMNITLG